MILYILAEVTFDQRSQCLQGFCASLYISLDANAMTLRDTQAEHADDALGIDGLPGIGQIGDRNFARE